MHIPDHDLFLVLLKLFFFASREAEGEKKPTTSLLIKLDFLFRVKKDACFGD